MSKTEAVKEINRKETNQPKISWKEIELEDKKIFDTIGKNADGIAMFSFASMFFWRKMYKTSYAIINGNIVSKGVSDLGDEVIYFPRGIVGNIKETVDNIICASQKDASFMPLTEETADKIIEVFPNAKKTLIDGKCEYVYNQSDLSALSGKKYHAKRNHIAKFDKSYTYEYININHKTATDEDIAMLRECAEYMFKLIENSPEDEFLAINTAIDSFRELSLRAGIITVDGNFVAYTIGSNVNADVADIHFEKADRSYEGSYAKINNCFAKFGFSDTPYLNREEDLGIEGLRKAKLSYYPCKLNQMFKVTF